MNCKIYNSVLGGVIITLALLFTIAATDVQAQISHPTVCPTVVPDFPHVPFVPGTPFFMWTPTISGAPCKVTIFWCWRQVAGYNDIVITRIDIDPNCNVFISFEQLKDKAVIEIIKLFGLSVFGSTIPPCDEGVSEYWRVGMATCISYQAPTEDIEFGSFVACGDAYCMALYQHCWRTDVDTGKPILETFKQSAVVYGGSCPEGTPNFDSEFPFILFLTGNPGQCATYCY